MPQSRSEAEENPRGDLDEHLGQALGILDQVANGQDVRARAWVFVAAHRVRLERWRQQALLEKQGER